MLKGLLKLIYTKSDFALNLQVYKISHNFVFTKMHELIEKSCSSINDHFRLVYSLAAVGEMNSVNNFSPDKSGF